MKLHITANRTNNISGEIVTMFFHAAIILGYTEKGGYYYEEGKSYYNHVVLTDTQARDIAYRISKMLSGTMTYEEVLNAVTLETEDEFKARAQKADEELEKTLARVLGKKTIIVTK